MNIIKKNSPNHYNGRNGWKADIIVFHQTGGTSVTPALNWYMNANAQCSPHFVVDVNGDVYQLVSLDNGAWCNGTNLTKGHRLYYGSSLSGIVRSRKANANFYTYSIEFVHCQWGNINEAQISAAVEIINTLIIPHMKKNKVTPVIDRAHFIGHSDVTPITRPNGSCPGKKFPYDEIISRVLGSKTPASVKPTKTVEEVAKEVISGKWGTGADRKKRLTDAGYDYYEVQAKVNEILRG